MSLLTRLIAPVGSEDKIPVHQFMAAIAEFQRGAPGLSSSAIAQAFELSPSEQTALETWYTGNVAGGPQYPRDRIHDVLMLGESGHYTLAQVQNRLGL